MKRRNDSGFTLVELMVVVLIIGILVAIAIPTFNNATQKAKINTCKANARIIDGAIAQAAVADGITLIEVAETLGSNPGKKLQEDGYIKEEPLCPFGEPYTIDLDTGTVVSHNHEN